MSVVVTLKRKAIRWLKKFLTIKCIIYTFIYLHSMNMDTRAILRVDVQGAFTPEGGLPVSAGREVVPGVNRVTEEARRQ